MLFNCTFHVLFELYLCVDEKEIKSSLRYFLVMFAFTI
jgi:hypothetical protein